MMSNMTLLFLKMLFCSSLIALSTNNWFQLWISLEFNMMFFIPLMFNLDTHSINSMMKYYIIQAIASTIFISMMVISQKFLITYYLCNLTTLAMSMKLGLFPIYFWYPQVSEGLSWFSFMLLSTWQKIIPLYIMSSSSKTLYPMIIILSALIGCLSLLRQTSLRKIFAFSSLTHMSWMMLAMYNKMNYWLLYLLVYAIIMIMLISTIKKQEMSSLNNFKSMNTLFKLKMTSSMMSLGGLPPLLGFFPKLLIINTNSQQLLWLLFILIITSLVSIFIYIQMMYPSIFYKNMKKTSSMNTNNNSFYLLNSLGLTPIIFFIF